MIFMQVFSCSKKTELLLLCGMGKRALVTGSSLFFPGSSLLIFFSVQTCKYHPMIHLSWQLMWFFFIFWGGPTDLSLIVFYSILPKSRLFCSSHREDIIIIWISSQAECLLVFTTHHKTLDDESFLISFTVISNLVLISIFIFLILWSAKIWASIRYWKHIKSKIHCVPCSFFFFAFQISCTF